MSGVWVGALRSFCTLPSSALLSCTMRILCNMRSSLCLNYLFCFICKFSQRQRTHPRESNSWRIHTPTFVYERWPSFQSHRPGCDRCHACIWGDCGTLVPFSKEHDFQTRVGKSRQGHLYRERRRFITFFFGIVIFSYVELVIGSADMKIMEFDRLVRNWSLWAKMQKDKSSKKECADTQSSGTNDQCLECLPCCPANPQRVGIVLRLAFAVRGVVCLVVYHCRHTSTLFGRFRLCAVSLPTWSSRLLPKLRKLQEW